jgi:hypothetical protein
MMRKVLELGEANDAKKGIENDLQNPRNFNDNRSANLEREWQMTRKVQGMEIPNDLQL